MPEPVLAQPSSAMAPRGSVLGFDFGLARIGVAVGELESGNAHALETISSESSDARFSRIAALIAEWRPVMLVVGLPSHPDGAEHELTRRCRRFANQLHGRFDLPVALIDERYTSVEADQRLAQSGGRGGFERKKRLDAAAAQIILQQFLDTHAQATTQR